MANEVFANGREISCKKADGKSIASFPDVCMTPPTAPPTPPGVPIPYPNTAFAKDTAKGSKTVKITGNEVMMKNTSYFKTSTGDEAGSAPKKGILTSKIKGKAYFTMWSMDVKVQGLNACRHMDLTTHNHNTPPNTGPWLYADTMALADIPEGKCRDQAKRFAEKCGPAFEKNKKTETFKGKKVDTVGNWAGLERDMCEDDDCKAARKCIMLPKKISCCKAGDGSTKTGHHVVPASQILKGGGDPRVLDTWLMATRIILPLAYALPVVVIQHRERNTEPSM